MLSGFLITGLLLDGRERFVATGKGNVWRIWRNFYLRRALRLFPLYYLVLAGMTIVGIVHVHDDLPWHLAYLTNYYVIGKNAWIGYPSPLWTLSVEEQFYLVWPLLILFLPLRLLPRVLPAVVMSGLLFRVIGVVWVPELRMWEYATPAQFDALGMGAWLAWLVRHPSAWWQRITTRQTWIALLFLGFAGVTLIVPQTGFARSLLISVSFALLVHGAMRGYQGWGGALLENPVMRYVGQISYGVYLLHNFAVPFTSWVYTVWPSLGRIPGGWYVVQCLFTFGLAALSWHCFEKPINRLKRRFPY